MSRISKQKIEQIAKRYIDLLRKDKFPVSQAYLFGSFARGEFRSNSDIDLCIVSPRFTENWDETEKYLWRKRREIDSRIEPIGYSPKEFKKDWLPLVAEIKEKGIKIV